MCVEYEVFTVEMIWGQQGSQTTLATSVSILSSYLAVEKGLYSTRNPVCTPAWRSPAPLYALVNSVIDHFQVDLERVMDTVRGAPSSTRAAVSNPHLIPIDFNNSFTFGLDSERPRNILRAVPQSYSAKTRNPT